MIWRRSDGNTPVLTPPALPPMIARPTSPGGNSNIPPDTKGLLGIYSAKCPWCQRDCIWAQYGPPTQVGPYTYDIRCNCDAGSGE